MSIQTFLFIDALTFKQLSSAFSPLSGHDDQSVTSPWWYCPDESNVMKQVGVH